MSGGLGEPLLTDSEPVAAVPFRIGVLLVNLGTPDSPGACAVGAYLSEFLMDGRVIDIPWVLRACLVRCIISPFRRFRSSREYRKVWTSEGSPLLVHTKNLAEKVARRMAALSSPPGEGRRKQYSVHFAMRYGTPSMSSMLDVMRKQAYDRVVVLPLYAQYASATTGSTLDEAMKIIRQWYVIPDVRLVAQYWDDEGYLECFCNRARGFEVGDYDHVLFSYHGVPIRQVDKVYEDRRCANHSCDEEINAENRFCYKATCYATTRALVDRLGIENYTVCFQSRIGNKWLSPFTDKVVVNLAENGHRRLLVFSPAFVADCLETTVEVGREYAELFKKHGGDVLDLVPSLNSGDDWVEAVCGLVQSHSA